MNLYSQYKSPFGYQVGDNGIDSYGVDHSGFSARDEIEYQTARDNRENQLMQMYNQQGVTENYPQYTTNFWGDAGNNYGFGSSNISQNIQNVTNRLNNSGFSGGVNSNSGFSVGVNGGGFKVGANNGQITTNSGYTVNTESLVGKPSSYFHNNNSVGGVNNQIQDNLSNPNCYVEFDGQNVDLYKYGQFDGSRLQNGQLQDNLSGQSGRDGYQSGIYQNVDNKGPIPEGTYYADQNQRQNISFTDAVIGTGVKALNGIGIPINRGKWKGGPISWGTKRVWLRPDANTNT